MLIPRARFSASPEPRTKWQKLVYTLLNPPPELLSAARSGMSARECKCNSLLATPGLLNLEGVCSRPSLFLSPLCVSLKCSDSALAAAYVCSNAYTPRKLPATCTSYVASLEGNKIVMHCASPTFAAEEERNRRLPGLLGIFHPFTMEGEEEMENMQFS